jgi:hypothetical protein
VGVPDGGVPRALVTGIYQPHRISLAGGYVYFTLDNSTATVRRCSVLVGGTCDILASNQNIPDGIVADTVNVYFTEFGAGNVNVCSVAGCLVPPTRIQTSLNSPAGVALEGAVLAIAEQGTNPQYTDGRVLACPLMGCSSGQVLSTGERAPVYVTIVRGIVYWGGLGSGPNFDNRDAQIKSCPATGCGGVAKVIADNQDELGQIAIDGGNIYWTRHGGGSSDGIYTCPVSGCPGSGPKLVALDPSPRGLAIDVTHIYFTSYEDDTVRRVAK